MVLSLNGSALYLGVSMGAVLGSFAVATGHIERIGFVGAACEFFALLLVSLAARRRTASAAPLADTA